MKVVSYYDGITVTNYIKFYKKRKGVLSILLKWKLYNVIEFLSSPSYIGAEKEELSKYYGDDFDFILEKEKIKIDRKNKIEKLLKENGRTKIRK